MFTLKSNSGERKDESSLEQHSSECARFSSRGLIYGLIPRRPRLCASDQRTTYRGLVDSTGVCWLGSLRAFCGLTFRWWRRERLLKGLFDDDTRPEIPLWRPMDDWTRGISYGDVRSILLPFLSNVRRIGNNRGYRFPERFEREISVCTWNWNSKVGSFNRADLWAQLSLEISFSSHLPQNFTRYIGSLANNSSPLVTPIFCREERKINFLAVESPAFLRAVSSVTLRVGNVTCRFSDRLSFISVPAVFHLIRGRY